MQLLLRKCNYKRGADTVILAGDIVNKGPKSLQALRLAMSEGFHAVRGNHDDFALAAALRVGRFATVASGDGGSGSSGSGEEEKRKRLPPRMEWVDQLTRCELCLEWACVRNRVDPYAEQSALTGCKGL